MLGFVTVSKFVGWTLGYQFKGGVVEFCFITSADCKCAVRCSHGAAVGGPTVGKV